MTKSGHQGYKKKKKKEKLRKIFCHILSTWRYQRKHGDFQEVVFQKEHRTTTLLGDQLMSMEQVKMSISEYFTNEVNMLMMRIIIHGLDPKYHAFISSVQGWKIQPSLLELENLVNQETLMEKFEKSNEIVKIRGRDSKQEL